jgi:hypothetical protein
MWVFLNPIFLAATAAAAIPLLLHLFARRRRLRIRFSTLRFLHMARRKTARRTRLENLLLLLLRSLILLLLALAFALPVVRTASFGDALGRSRRDVALVVDTSFSMGYATSAREVWKESLDAARAIVQGLREGDRACLFAAGEEVTPLIPEPVADLDFVRAQVDNLKPDPSSSRLMPAVAAAAQALVAAGRSERELYMITDGQALPWADFRGAVGGTWDSAPYRDTVAFFTLLAGAASPENVAPVDLTLTPPILRAGHSGEIAVRVLGGPAIGPLTLSVNGLEAARREPKDGQAEVKFTLPPLPPGLHAGQVDARPDGLPADNTLRFLIDVRDALPVLVAGAPSDVFFLRRALSPAEGAGVEVREVRPEQLGSEDPRKYAAVFLANAFPLDGPAVQALESCVRQGGLLAVFPGDRAAPADYASLSVLPAVPASVDETPAESRRNLLWLLRPRDALLAPLRLPPGSAPVVAIQRMLAWHETATNSVALIGAQGERPFLLARDVDQGRVLFFAVAADRSWSDFPLSPVFLPVMHLIAQHGAGLGRRPPFVRTSRNFALADAGLVLHPGESLVKPDGAAVALRRVRFGNRVADTVEGWLPPGLYDIAGDQGRRPALAVNLQSAESDLTPLPTPEIERLLDMPRHYVATGGDDLLKLVEQHREGRPMTEAILWAVLALAAMEAVLANWCSRGRKTLTESLTVTMSGRVKEHAT